MKNEVNEDESGVSGTFLKVFFQAGIIQIMRYAFFCLKGFFQFRYL